MMDDSTIQRAQISSPLKAGDHLLSSKPYAYALDKNMQSTHCDECLAMHGQLRKCSSCAFVYYCGVQCQRKAWTLHKKECCLLQKKCGKLVTTTTRIITRIILSQQSGNQEPVETAYEGRDRTFNDLMSHEEEIKSDEKALEKFANLRQQLIMYLGEEKLPQKLLSIYGKVITNSYTITDQTMNTIGLGLYLAGSIFDHSCSPNAHPAFVGKNLVVKSLVDWESLEWDKVYISYCDILQDRESRQKELSSGFYFDCDCDLCEDKEKEAIMNSIICGKSSCGEEILQNQILSPCSSCGYNDYDETTLTRYEDLIDSTKEILKKDPKVTSSCVEYMDDLEKLIARQKGFLSPRNVWLVKTLDHAFECCLFLQDMKKAQLYCSQNLEGLEFCLGKSHPVLGLQYLKLAKVEKFLFHVAETYYLLEKAESILRKSHVQSSHFYRKDVKGQLETARLEMQLLRLNPNPKIV